MVHLEQSLLMKNELAEEWEVPTFMQHVMEGHCNFHILGIFNENIESERHRKFFSDDPAVRNELRAVSWLGPSPIEKDDMPFNLYDYLAGVFQDNIGNKPYIAPYIYEVWLPEVMIKAVSQVKNISREDAEIYFTDMDCDMAGMFEDILNDGADDPPLPVQLSL